MMTKTIHKSLCAFLAVLLIAISSVNAMATDIASEEENNISSEYLLDSDDISAISTDLNWRAIGTNQYEKVEVGNYIPAYVWIGDELISSEDEVLFYPIYGDNEIVSILTVFEPTGDRGYTVGKDFADELNAATHNKDCGYFLVEAGTKLYLYSDDGALLIKEYPEPEKIDKNSFAFDLESYSSEDNQGPQTDGRPNVEASNKLCDYNLANSLTAEDLNKYLLDTSRDYKTTVENTSACRNLSQRIDITPERKPQSRKMHYLDVEKLYQGDSESCTFYASTIIGNFLTKQSKTPAQIMNWIGKTKGNIFDAQSVINDYYGENYSYIYEIYGKAANEFITRGYPLYAAFYDPDLTKGHAVAVCGYSDAGDYGIGVMETLTGTFKAITPSSPSKYPIRAYSVNCYWTATLYYQYWD